MYLKRSVALVCTLAMTGWLGGCASSSGYMPITSDMVTESGEHVVKLGGYTKNASVARTAEVHNTLRNRDTQYRMAYVKAGFKMEFAMQEQKIQVPGMDQPIILSSYLPTVIEFREMPHFDQQLPTKPSDHAVWDTTKSIVNNIVNKGLIGWGLSELSSTIKAGYDAAGSTTTYQGPVNMANSNNSGTEQSFSAAAQYQGAVDNSSEVAGEEGTE